MNLPTTFLFQTNQYFAVLTERRLLLRQMGYFSFTKPAGDWVAHPREDIQVIKFHSRHVFSALDLKVGPRILHLKFNNLEFRKEARAFYESLTSSSAR
jgi:hypothetical protein